MDQEIGSSTTSPIESESASTQTPITSSSVTASEQESSDLQAIATSTSSSLIDDQSQQQTSTLAPQTTTIEPKTSDDESNQDAVASSASNEQRKRSAFKQDQPADQKESKKMLLTPELIEKLMENESVVNLMTKQLERTIGKENLKGQQRKLVVRQVFDSMMNKSVDLSSQNIQKAVNVVASSYKPQKKSTLASNKQNAKRSQVAPRDSSKRKDLIAAASSTTRTHLRVDTKGFGRRSPTSTATPNANTAQSNGKNRAALQTALKLTAANRQTAKKQTSASDTGGQVDSSGNPIVVVLLPQERA